MNYLLWNPSYNGEESEHFVLVQSEANEELVTKYIKDYFHNYQLLLKANDIAQFDENEIKVASFTEDEIGAWYYHKKAKQVTEEHATPLKEYEQTHENVTFEVVKALKRHARL